MSSEVYHVLPMGAIAMPQAEPQEMFDTCSFRSIDEGAALTFLLSLRLLSVKTGSREDCPDCGCNLAQMLLPKKGEPNIQSVTAETP